MGLLLGGHLYAPPLGTVDFSPTYIVARTTDTGGSWPGLALWGSVADANPQGGFASVRCNIWARATSTDTLVQMSINNRNGNSQLHRYFDTSGASLGDPGTGGSNAMLLGVRADEIRITVAVIASIGDGGSHQQIGTFTDNVFFSPTNLTNYGYQDDCVSEVPPGNNDADDYDIEVTFTFRKTGYNDLTVTYRTWADSAADVDA